MKQSDAQKWVRRALWATQKARSDLMEMAGSDKVMQAIQADLMPWIMEEDRLLNPLLKVVERIDNGGEVRGQELYNFMYVIHTWAAPVQMCQLLSDERTEFPRPDVRWNLGWEDNNG